MNFFKSARTVAEIKYCYRQLADRFHPDRPEGDLGVMQMINSQYLKALEGCDNQRSHSCGQTYTYHFDEIIEASVIEMLDILHSLKMQDVEIYLIGTWLWVSGSKTKDYKA